MINKERDKKPNIVFILADQLRKDFLSCYGAGFIKTPNIDMLAEHGIKYERAVSPSPLCVPARASLLTGLNAIKNGVLDNNHWLRPDREDFGIKTWPEVLSENGYETQAIGKMHFYPWDIAEGFDSRIIAEDKRHILIEDDYFDYITSKGYKKYHGLEMDEYISGKGEAISPIPLEHQVDTWVGAKSCEYINDYEGEKPFALMVGFPGPHDPYDPPGDEARKCSPSDMPESAPENEISRAFAKLQAKDLRTQPWCRLDLSEFSEESKKKMRSYYAALVGNIDTQVGNIIRTLEEKNILDETVIILSSDHGDYLGDYGLFGKATFFESSINIPLIIKPVDKYSAKKIDTVVSLTDIFSTILHFAGASYHNEAGDSRVLPMGNGEDDTRQYVFGCSALGYFVHDGRYKLMKYHDGSCAMYDLKMDEYETKNLYDKKSAVSIVRRLEVIAQKEIVHSYSLAACCNYVDGSRYVERLSRDEVAMRYYRKGWRRKYPFNIKDLSK
jgi:arylsulfatase A-like enzyme